MHCCVCVYVQLQGRVKETLGWIQGYLLKNNQLGNNIYNKLYVNLNLKKDIVSETITFNIFISDLNKARGDYYNFLML